MNGVLLAARLVLGGVLAVAGAAKIADRAGTRETIVGFGLPAASAAPLSFLVPVLELAVAAALLTDRVAVAGAAGALALLTVFSLAIAVTLARGRTLDCHCFGGLHSTPVGWSTLARNGLLALLAAFVAWRGGGAGLGGPLADLGTAGVLALLALVGSAWLGWSLLRQNGRLLLRIEQLEAALADALPAPATRAAPAFELPRLDGGFESLDSLLARAKPLLLVFTDPGCGPCRQLMPEVAGWQQQRELTVAVVSRGEIERNRAEAGRAGLGMVLVQEDREVSTAYGVSGTPSAALVGADGTVDGQIAAGATQIRELFARALAARPSARAAAAPMLRGLEPGTQVDLQLPLLEGGELALDELQGRQTLLVNWNPQCGYCQLIAPELAKLEGDLRARGTELVLVAAGTADANEALAVEHALTVPILLRRDRQVPAFEHLGTPVAYLLDEQRRVSGPLAVGANEVIALARGAVGREAAVA